MSGDPTDFTNLRRERIPIKLATTDSTQAAGIGTELLKAAKRPIHLASSLFVPKLRSTLISAACLADKYTILMQSGKFWLLPKQAEPDTRSALATGSAVNGVYQFDDLASPSAAAAATTPTSSFRIPAQYRRLHNVFNHAHLRKLQQLASLYPSLAPAQPRRTANVEHSCEPCHIDKLTSAPHPSSLFVCVKLPGAILQCDHTWAAWQGPCGLKCLPCWRCSCLQCAILVTGFRVGVLGDLQRRINILGLREGARGREDCFLCPVVRL
jgi:hypothetical protein